MFVQHVLNDQFKKKQKDEKRAQGGLNEKKQPWETAGDNKNARYQMIE